MQKLVGYLAAGLLAAGLAAPAGAAETVHLYAPYSYGLLASATCGKGEPARLKVLVKQFAAVAGATKDAGRDDGEAYCAAFTKAFPVNLKWGDIILAKADAAGDDAPQPMSDPEGGKGPGTRVEELEISFLGLKVKIKFGPKQPADSEGHTGGGDDGGDDEGGEDPPADGGEPSEPPK